MDTKKQKVFQLFFEAFKSSLNELMQKNPDLISDSDISLKDLFTLVKEQDLFSTLLNFFMLAERSIFLKHNHNPNNRANGYYNRSIEFGSNRLDIAVPRTRNADFYPEILGDKYKRNFTESKHRLMHALLLSGVSNATAKRILKNLGLSYDEEIMEDLRQEIENYYKGFIQRKLKSDYAILYIDGMHVSVKVEVKEGVEQVIDFVLYVVIGIDMQGVKQVIHFEAIEGAESADKWMRVLNNLYDRGVSRVSLVVSDNLSGINGVISAIFPKADHQLCIAHLIRNLSKRLPRAKRREAIELLKNIIHEDKEVAIMKFNKLIQLVSEESKVYAEKLKKDMDRYLAFLNYPKGIRKYIYTTNPIESLNSIYRAREYAMSGFFNSMRNMILNISYETRRINEKWRRNSVPRLKAYMYELRKIHLEKYRDEISQDMLD